MTKKDPTITDYQRDAERYRGLKAALMGDYGTFAFIELTNCFIKGVDFDKEVTRIAKKFNKKAPTVK